MAHQTGIQAVVLSPEDLETLGSIDFIHRTGERMQVEPESLNEDDMLILYPEDLGNSEIEQADLKLLRETLKGEGITFKDFLDDDESIIDRIAGINRNRDALKKEKPESTEEIDAVALRQKNELLALYLQKYKDRKVVKDETRQKLSGLLGDILGGSKE